MSKLDLSKKYKTYYTSKQKPELVDIEEAQYISLKGIGDPSGDEFAKKIQALYPVIYTIKFTCKENGQDFVVPKLEGLWSFDMAKYGDISMEEAPKKIPRSEWSYRLLIRLPEFVTEDMLLEAKKTVKKKDIPHIDELTLYRMREGKSVQILHVGPFDKEPESLMKLQDFMTEKGLVHNGEHHEIYLSDFRRTAPEKLRTILREPVK